MVFKTITKYLLAIGKGLVAAGAGVFAAAKSIAYTANSKAASTSVAGRTAGAFFGVTSFISVAAIRLPRMLRDSPEKKSEPPQESSREILLTEMANPLLAEELSDSEEFSSGTDSNLDTDEEIFDGEMPIKLNGHMNGNGIPVVVEKTQPSFFSSPFATTRWGSAAYVSVNFMTGIYAVLTGFNGYLSAFSISELFAGALNFIFPDYVSDKIDDAEWKLYVLHVFAIYLFLSNFTSYYFSNWTNIQIKYLPALIQGKWKEYDKIVFVKVIPYLMMNAFSTKFAGDNTINLLNQYTLNPLSSTLTMSNTVSNFFSYLNVVATSTNFAIVNIPSMQSHQRPIDKSEWHKRHAPECYNRRQIIWTAIGCDAFATAAVGATAFAAALEGFFSIDSQHIAVKISSLVPFLFVFNNTFAANGDAFRIEMDSRVELKLSPQALEGFKRIGTFSQPLPRVSSNDNNHSPKLQNSVK